MSIVALTDPQSELWQSEVCVRSPLQQSPVQRMAVYEEFHLGPAHGHCQLVPGVVGQSVGEGLHVDHIVQL